MTTKQTVPWIRHIILTGLLCLFSGLPLHAQDENASWNLAVRMTADIPGYPESFKTYWQTTAGTGLELVWYAGQKTGFTLGIDFCPFSINGSQWKEELEPKTEGSAKLEFRKGQLNAFIVTAGLKKTFPFENKPFLLFIRMAGECGYFDQRGMQVSAVFPARTYHQKLSLGLSRYAYGGCAGFGAEVKLNSRWGLGISTDVHYVVFEKQDVPSPDYHIRTRISSDETGRGFGFISGSLRYYFGFSGPGK